MNSVLYDAYHFIWFLRQLTERIFDALPDVYDLVLLVFFTTLVLGVLKSARYKESGQ